MAQQRLVYLTEISNASTGDFLTVYPVSGDPVSTITKRNLDKVVTENGITASTTQSQGEQQLTAVMNEISTVNNANDVVTLPEASAGDRVLIINNGANALDVYPASGDNAGGGVDTAVTISSGSNQWFSAYDDTNWVQA